MPGRLKECVSQRGRKKEKITSTSGIQTHLLLLSGQVHYGELQMVGSGNECLSNVKKSLTPKQVRSLTDEYVSAYTVNVHG